jgi:hypothetical protein
MRLMPETKAVDGSLRVLELTFQVAKPIPMGRTRQIMPTLVQGRRPPPYPRWGKGQLFDLDGVCKVAQKRWF